MEAIKLGQKGEAQLAVTESYTAIHAKSGELPVFGTPYVAALVEQAAADSVKPFLQEGQTTVGTMIKVNHLAATAVGGRVRAETELVGLDGRRLVFRAQVFDEAGLVAEAEHERFTVDVQRFMQKAENRGKQGENHAD